MARTTEVAVAGIVDVDSDIDLTPSIEAANALVTAICVDVGNPTEYSSTVLELIERWLAAHFYVIRDPSTEQDELDKVVERKKLPQVAMVFHGTKEGQQAMALDYYGGLAALSKKIAKGKSKVSIGWLGSQDQDNSGGDDQNPLW